MTNADREITQWVEETSFVDTHEHLIEESQRVSGVIDRWLPCDDWTYVFNAYVANDLAVAGMPSADLQRLFGPDLSSRSKYELIAHYWDRIRHTGYAQAVRHTLRGLYGEDDLTAESLPRIAENTVISCGPASAQTSFVAHMSNAAKSILCSAFSWRASSWRYSPRISASWSFAVAALLTLTGWRPRQADLRRHSMNGLASSISISPRTVPEP
ncbi:hypothetical protein [Bradyrhizobium sp. WSM1743]|uniref:hypothetical protein n=1 Tax=Bradyrhizobium sp. WSM1743 TaxID=318996 RepID=UPI000486C077|nr:hypothetical protein [Bradyrhizobium sp. WSM1743]